MWCGSVCSVCAARGRWLQVRVGCVWGGGGWRVWRGRRDCGDTSRCRACRARERWRGRRRAAVFFVGVRGRHWFETLPRARAPRLPRLLTVLDGPPTLPVTAGHSSVSVAREKQGAKRDARLRTPRARSAPLLRRCARTPAFPPPLSRPHSRLHLHRPGSRRRRRRPLGRRHGHRPAGRRGSPRRGTAAVGAHRDLRAVAPGRAGGGAALPGTGAQPRGERERERESRR